MPSVVISVTSAAHFKAITAGATYTVVDFYADWCGPCKAISPVFEQLAAAESRPGRIVFCKVNVDDQRDVAATYGVSAMPTFLILRGSSVKETVRGANPTALRTAILSVAADAAKGSAHAAPSFSHPGQTLGGGPGRRPPTGNPLPNLGAMVGNPASFAQGRGLLQIVVRFVGLYLTTLFSLEPAASARVSPFAVRPPGTKAQ